MLFERCYRISIAALAFLYGRAKTIRIQYVWTRSFGKRREKNLRVLKNIRIRVGRCLIWAMVILLTL